jgi:DNA-binding LytR/AlgR family response regulator
MIHFTMASIGGMARPGEERLDPKQFMRVHRSVIVRLTLVELLHRSPGGDYAE